MARGVFVTLGVCPKTSGLSDLSEVTQPELPDAPYFYLTSYIVII